MHLQYNITLLPYVSVIAPEMFYGASYIHAKQH